MTVMLCSHRRILFSLLLVFFLSLAGCMGGPGGAGLQDKSSANVSVSASATSVTEGQGVTLEAYVNPVLATGTVTFYSGSTAIGTAALSEGLTTEIALLQTTFSSVGPQSITAKYSGNDFYSAGTSAAMTIGVYNGNLASSSVTLQASTTTPQYQTNVMLTATVSPSAATGTVTFYNGSTNIGSATVSGGAASVTASFAAGGTATLHAVYSGDYNYLSSTSNSLAMTVSGPLVTSTTLKVSTSSVAIGGNVTLTATLTPATVTGTVTFYNGSTAIGTANVNAGVATLNTTFAASGHITLTAGFAGNSSWEPSASNQVSLFVTGDTPDTVVLQTAPFSVIIGYSATLTATITPAAATGSVTFYDGTVVLGNSTVSGGAATLVDSFMSAGAQNLTAVYSGDTTYISGISSPVTLQVSDPGPTPTTTALALSEYSGYDGDFVTLTATIVPAAATGQVDFYDNGSLVGHAVVSSGTAAYSQVFTQDGDNEITAVYQGDITYSSSKSASQDLVLSEPPSSSNPTPSCPSDPIDCQIECPENPSCTLNCPSDPTLCSMECPGYAGCPTDPSSSSLKRKQGFNLDAPLKLREPLLMFDGFRKKGC
ncbi:MAG: Ig-like domain-containing protein [Terracidiphilus sp.]